MNNKGLIEIYNEVESRNEHDKEFLQAVYEVLLSLEPVVERDESLIKDGIIRRLCEFERIIKFRVPWVDDKGEVRVNRGYRVEFNSAIGPYKGGLRFHPSVNESIIKFLGFEQVFKNSLTTLPMGGGKGGSDFDPKGKSDMEVMRFCQSFMNELFRHIGERTDVPAGDIGVGAREIGYLFGQYKKITNKFVGVLTGKGLTYGGSLFRTEATGYGLCYYTENVLNKLNDTGFKGKKVAISGAGNVAIYAAKKVYELGGIPITVSDSNGYIYDKDGIDIELIREIKEVKRGRVKDYKDKKQSAVYKENARVWEVPCDIALPCATQNELDINDAKNLIKNGVMAVSEGANMPTTPDAIDELIKAGVSYGPAKAANAGGVAASGLEMSQNAINYSWTFEEVDKKIQAIMKDIFESGYNAAKEYGFDNNLMVGSNIAGFLKVADAMKHQGIV